MEHDFIQRTLEIIEQFEPKEHEREVTLQLNCLLGLLSYPQQIAAHDQGSLNKWLTSDKVGKVGPEWGIQPDYIKCPGYKRVENKEGEKCPCCGQALSENKLEPFDIKKLTLRNLIRQMRNAAAHATSLSMTVVAILARFA
jgi:hypothetical protein